MADNMAIKVGLFAGAAYLAYTQGWLSFLGIGTSTDTTATTSTGTTSTATAATGATSSTPAPTTSSAPSFNSLDALYSRLVAAASKDGVTSTGPDGWNYYASQVGAPSPMPAPEDAGLTRVDMTSAQYWASMAPLLKTKFGLAGLGIYGGLGALVRRYR